MTDHDPPTITFGAVGDVGLRRGVAEGMQRHGMEWPFEPMRDELARADLLFGNMETVLVPQDYPEEELEPMGMIAPFPAQDCARVLAEAGFDVLNLAANHVLDAGVVGMEATQAALEEAGIATFGVGHSQENARRPRIVTVGGSAGSTDGGLRIGLLGYCEDGNYSLGTPGPGHAYFEPDAVVEDVRRLRDEDVDLVVVSVHADLEFMPTPSPARRDAFRRIARAGADLVLGHHPHVPQGCERVDGSLIAYSLGNFVFPAHSSSYMRENGPDTAWSYLLLVELSEDGVGAHERVPFTIGAPPDERPVPCEGTERTRRLERLEELDRALQDDEEVARVWREVALRKLAVELPKAVTWKRRPTPLWKRAIGRALGLSSPADIVVDVDRVLEELVGRWCLTAENRAWMEEVLAAGRERWELRNTGPADRLHRPHHRFDRSHRRARRT